MGSLPKQGRSIAKLGLGTPAGPRLVPHRQRRLYILPSNHAVPKDKAQLFSPVLLSTPQNTGVVDSPFLCPLHLILETSVGSGYCAVTEYPLFAVIPSRCARSRQSSTCFRPHVAFPLLLNKSNTEELST